MPASPRPPVPSREVAIVRDFRGPTILELAPVMESVTASPVRVRWRGGKDEVGALAAFPGREFVLCVEDFPARDRACAALGLPLAIEASVLERGRIMLVDPKACDWRGFCGEQAKARGTAPKYILLKLAADSVRRGHSPPLAEVMEPLFLGGVGAHDADVLLRLKSGRLG